MSENIQLSDFLTFSGYLEMEYCAKNVIKMTSKKFFQKFCHLITTGMNGQYTTVNKCVDSQVN